MLIKQFVPDSVSDKDKDTYSRVMSNWSYLSSYLAMRNPNREVVGILLRIELDGKNRLDIIERLTSRLVSCIRVQIKQEAEQLHEGKASRGIPESDS